MYKLNTAVPMPAEIAALPKMGEWPIPWFAATLPTGVRDLRYMDGAKLREGYEQGLCWICGQKLDSICVVLAKGWRPRPVLAFIGGPLAVRNRRFSDWASHEACAEYAELVCPFLTGQKLAMDQGGGKAPPGAIDRRPKYSAIYVATTVVRDGSWRSGVNWLPGPPERVRWFHDGVEVPVPADLDQDEAASIKYAMENP